MLTDVLALWLHWRHIVRRRTTISHVCVRWLAAGGLARFRVRNPQAPAIPDAGEGMPDGQLRVIATEVGGAVAARL